MSAPTGRLTPEQAALVERNLGLVYKVARRFERQGRASGHDVEDLVQEGSLGLMAAAQSYDPARGAFSTHAVEHITGAIQHLVNRQNGLVRVDWRVYYRSGRVRHDSLDEPITNGTAGDHAPQTLADVTPDPQVDVEGEVTARVQDEQLSTLFVRLVNAGVLTPGEGYVLARIAGLLPAPDRDGAATTEDRPHKMCAIIARERGVSRERIRQLRNAGMAKLAPYLAQWDSPEKLRVLTWSVQRTTRRAAPQTTKPANPAPKPAKHEGARATGVSSTGNGSELESPTTLPKRFKRTGTPRRGNSSTNAA